MVSHCGGGLQPLRGLAVTRWRADGTTTRRAVLLREGRHPRPRLVGGAPAGLRARRLVPALLATDRVTFHRVGRRHRDAHRDRRRAGGRAEVRRVTVTNNGGASREIELTSYGEIVLGPPDADRAHPPSRTSSSRPSGTSGVRRSPPRGGRARPTEPALVRARGGRGPERVGPRSAARRTAPASSAAAHHRAPRSRSSDGPLSGTTGAVLDPIFALRTRVRLEPGQSASVAFTTLVADHARARLRARRPLPRPARRAARARPGLDLPAGGAARARLTPADAAVFQELAGHLFYPRRRAARAAGRAARNRGSQPLLWANGISGDWPIVLATIDPPTGCRRCGSSSPPTTTGAAAA
jgi:cyclic beta-1,2-glucan synthetase